MSAVLRRALIFAVLAFACALLLARPAGHPPAAAANDPSGFHLPVVVAVGQRGRRARRDHDRAQRHQRGRADPLHHARRRRQVRGRPSAPPSIPTTSTRSRASSTSRPESRAKSFERADRRSRRAGRLEDDPGVAVRPVADRHGVPHKAVLTILDNDPVTPRDPQNPLALATSPTTGNPLTGATFFVDPESEVAHAAGGTPALKTISTRAGHGALRKLQLRPQRRPEHRHRGVALPDARIGRGAGHRAAARDLPDRARIVRARVR